MKPYIKIASFVLLSLFMWSCEDFLTESSQDEVRPSTVRDMEQLLKGEIYFNNTGAWGSYFNVTDYFTDDIQCNGWVNKKEPNQETFLLKGRWMFTWDRQMYAKDGGGDNAYVWYQPYARIKGCNVILEYLDKVVGDNTLREYLSGEAYAMRAYYYFNLVNLFGEPYNVGDPSKNLGVPLKLTMSVTQELFERNTVKEVYDLIESDLLKALKLMEENPVEKLPYYRMTRLGVLSLLSKMYLYQEKWDKALEYADRVLKEKPELLNLASLQTSFNYDAQSKSYGVYNANSPAEIIFACRTAETTSTSSMPPYSTSKNLMDTYEYNYMRKTNLGDLRGFFYFQYYKYTDMYNRPIWAPFYERKDFSNETCTGIRTAEVYLNRAEANIRKFMLTGTDEFRVKALADLNKLRENRFDTRNTPYAPVEIADGQELFDFYKAERRRELCGEGFHRWFDLRRFGKQELKHVYLLEPGASEEVFTLSAGSPSYLLPIPQSALDANPKLAQNP